MYKGNRQSPQRRLTVSSVSKATARMNETSDLFDAVQGFEPLRMADANVQFKSAFYVAPLSRRYKDALLAQTPWRQEKIRIRGKEHWQPRLVSWYGDPGAVYSYSGITLHPHEWTDTLLQIKHDVEASIQHRFNSVLLNLYRNESDSIGWHSDDEAELGESPVIASLSFGATRIFKLKHKTGNTQKPISIELTDGSLLIMAGSTQKYWLHGIEKTRKSKDRRINLTFRNIVKR